MAKPAPKIPQHPPQAIVDAQIRGNKSQRRNNYLAGGALLVSLLVGAMNVYWHLSSESKKDNDDHINELIKEQIKPVGEIAKDEHISRLVSDQLKPLIDNVNKIGQDVAYLKGKAGIANTKLDKVRKPDANSLAESSNPDKALTGIRISLEQAQDRKKILPEPTLADYKKKVQTLPTSATDYWATVAAIINYQSYVNQMENKAPDPLRVAKACPFVTKGSGSDNLIQGAWQFTACVVDLDGTQNRVEGAVFENSVIRWHGGPVTIKNATFINCRFVIDIKTEPARPDLLKQLLASDQTYFTLTTAG